MAPVTNIYSGESMSTERSRHTACWPIALALTFLIASPAHAQTALGVKLVGQQTSQWCYGATTQMIGSQFGSSLSQCQMANLDNDRTDCCQSPTPGGCINGGDTSDQLDYWGFPHTFVGDSISYSTIKNEIDAGRPVATSWEWDGGGRHAIVVDGYWTKSDGSRWVEILNPLPVNTGDREWTTYSAYLTSAFGPHSVVATDYGLHWGPICQIDFFGLDADDYQQCFDQRVHHGDWPTNLATGDGSMSGTFHGSSNRPVISNASRSGLEKFVNSHQPGWRPKMITVSDDVTFDAILISDEGKVSETAYALDGTDFHNTNSALNSAGYQLVDLFAYNDDVPRFAATWVKQSGDYRVDRAMTVDDFRTKDSTNNDDGFVLARVSTYYDSNDNFTIAALWLPSTVQHYTWLLRVSDDTFQSHYNDWVVNKGYSLAYTSKQDDVYNIIFTR